MTAVEHATVPCPLCDAPGPRRVTYDLAELRVERCACRFVSLGVSPDRAALEAMYDAGYFEERHRYFFERPSEAGGNGQADENLAEFADGLRLVGEHVPRLGRLLDIGCGVGVFLEMARGRGWQVAGVDISAYAVQHARDQRGLDARCGVLRDMQFADGSFDVVTMWDVLEHLPDPLAELREVRRVLRPGGCVLINTPNEGSLLKVLARLGYRLSLGRLVYPVRKLYHQYHLCYFTPDTLRRLLERAGLRVMKLSGTCIPTVKARGTQLEKRAVWALRGVERLLGREYQLLALAQPATADGGART